MVRRDQCGFTLIELVMVIVIMGALSAVAFARFNRSDFQVQAAAKELVAAIRYTQDKSMSHTGATNYRIAIVPSGYSVTQGGAAIIHPIDGSLGYSRSWSDISLDTTATLSFDGYGNPGLAAPLTITLSQGAASTTITVEDVTGFAR